MKQSKSGIRSIPCRENTLNCVNCVWVYQILDTGNPSSAIRMGLFSVYLLNHFIRLFLYRVIADVNFKFDMFEDFFIVSLLV